MLQDIFLIYANHSLKENPEIFYKIYQEFKNPNNIHIEKSYDELISDIIKYFVTFVKCDDLETAYKTYRDETEKCVKTAYEMYGNNKKCSQIDHERYMDEKVGRPSIIKDLKIPIKISFDAVYGYRDGYCEFLKCPNFSIIDHINDKLLIGPERLKCYECNQLYFKEVLTGIAEAKGCLEIPIFKKVHPNGIGVREFKRARALENNRHDIKPEIQTLLEGFIGKSFIFLKDGVLRSIELSEEEKLDEGFILGPKLVSPDSFAPNWKPNSFTDNWRSTFGNLFLWQIVGYSLTEFLLKNDPKKLKKCKDKKCNEFHTNPSEYCSRKCYDRDYHRHYMRQKRDPESPKYDQKYKTREFG